MTLLTDSEQKRLLVELYNSTQTKLDAAFKKYGLDKIPAKILTEIETLRSEQKAQHNKGRGLWQAIWHGVGVVKAEGDKLFKE